MYWPRLASTHQEQLPLAISIASLNLQRQFFLLRTVSAANLPLSLPQPARRPSSAVSICLRLDYCEQSARTPPPRTQSHRDNVFIRKLQHRS
jgi:hypothetical protein